MSAAPGRRRWRRARQLGPDFSLYRFFDEVNGAGMIPVSVIHWQLTGQETLQ